MLGVNVNGLLSTPQVTFTYGPSGAVSRAGYWHPQKSAEAGVARYVPEGIARMRAAVPPGTPIAITEYGLPQDQSNFTGPGLQIGPLIQKIIDTAQACGLVGVVWWQIFDNEEQSPGVPRGFHLYSRNGTSTTHGALSGAGTKYASIL